jgi:hypothetical protein
MKRKKLFTTIVLSLVVLIGACSKDEFQDYVGVCPIVIATNPTTGETNVALGTPISFTFNEEMNPATINQSSFTAVYGSTSLAGTFTYSGNTATFTPSSNLLVNTTYVCKITTAVKDLRGNALQEDYIWTFSTGLNLQPTIISTDPISNEMGVALNKIITATFNMPMDVATINASTFTLKQGLVPLSGVVILTGDTASFTPDVALVSNTIYTALITTGAKNLAGISIAANYEWNFTTGNTTAPIVTITDPYNNENGVALNKVI